MASEAFRLVSPTFHNGGRIPRKYTGDGQGALKDISPPLEWYGVPEGTESLALVVQDIDAPDPSGPIVPWTHWVVLNIPPSIKGLPEGFSRKEEVVGGEYAGIKEGNNDWKVPGWRGPKPPTGGHRYQFKLYALDQMMNLGNKIELNFIIYGEHEVVQMMHGVDFTETIMAGSTELSSLHALPRGFPSNI